MGLGMLSFVHFFQEIFGRSPYFNTHPYPVIFGQACQGFTIWTLNGVVRHLRVPIRPIARRLVSGDPCCNLRNRAQSGKLELQISDPFLALEKEGNKRNICLP